jgi:dolichol-phosphate mannosyltransferase
MTQEGAKPAPAFSLVVPCYGEELALPLLFKEAIPALDKATGGNFEMILVDDGSTDKTYDLIVAQHRLDPRIKGIQLSRNFGHQPALTCGLAFAGGDFIGVIDADLQDPIPILLELYEAVRQDTCDICYGVRRKRDAPAFLIFFYGLFYWLINRFADHPWPRNAGDFSAFNREVLATLIALPEKFRMVRGLRSWIGFRQQPFPYDRPRRAAGVSKYNIVSLTRLAASAFLGFTHTPLQIAIYLGLGMAFLNLIPLLLFFLQYFHIMTWTPFPTPNWQFVILFFYISFGASAMFLCFGILGEYISVIVGEVKRRPTAIVRQVIGDIRRWPKAEYVLCRDSLVAPTR